MLEIQGIFMIVVYIKHYLNENGIKYFDETWYPTVEGLIKQQDGYVLIEATAEAGDLECRNITVQFKGQTTLDAWVAHDDHQAVINDLDQFRTRAWHYVIKKENDLGKPADLRDWEEVPLA
jgi:hypothetical protein